MRNDTDSQRILIVDDDVNMCRLLTRLLELEGYCVGSTASGHGMWRAIRTQTFDLIILDLRLLHGEDGLALARRLQKESDIPFIILTGQNDQVDKVVGLEIGADDYITKPFDRRELIARLRCVLRRSRMQSGVNCSGQMPVIIQFAGWTLDMTRYELTSPEGKQAELTSYEFQLLAVLAQNPGRLLSRDQMLERLASRHWDPADRSIDVHIGKLRRKLRDDPRSPRLIKTIRGIGYIFAPDANQLIAKGQGI